MAKAAKSATQKAGTSPSRKLAVKKDTLKDLGVHASGQAVKGGLLTGYCVSGYKPLSGPKLSGGSLSY